MRCAYIELVVTDLAAARAFYVDVLGLYVTAEDERAIYLRAFEEFIHHNLVLRAGAGAPPSPRSPSGCARPRTSTAPRPGTGSSGCRIERRPDGFVRGHRRRGARARTRSASPTSSSTTSTHVERLTWRYDLLHGGRAGAAGPLQPGHPGRAAAAAPTCEDLGFRVSEDIQDAEGTDVRGVDAPQADRPRHRPDRRRRPAHAPHRVRHPREAQHPRRSATSSGRCGSSDRDRARPRPPRRLERVLPLPARPRRPPRRDLHAGLLHRRPGQPGRHLGRARQPAPRLVGQPGRAALVHRGVASCSTSTATRSRCVARTDAERDGRHDRRRRLLLHARTRRPASSSATRSDGGGRSTTRRSPGSPTSWPRPPAAGAPCPGSRPGTPG